VGLWVETPDPIAIEDLRVGWYAEHVHGKLGFRHYLFDLMQSPGQIFLLENVLPDAADPSGSFCESTASVGVRPPEWNTEDYVRVSAVAIHL